MVDDVKRKIEFNCTHLLMPSHTVSQTGIRQTKHFVVALKTISLSFVTTSGNCKNSAGPTSLTFHTCFTPE